jgi:hypothetical protein
MKLRPAKKGLVLWEKIRRMGEKKGRSLVEIKTLFFRIKILLFKKEMSKFSFMAIYTIGKVR